MYTEKQLAIFVKTPSKRQVATAGRTHEAVREAISLYYNKQAIENKYDFYPNFDIFLQGSYRNDTDIQKTSDVDIVICLQNIFETSNPLVPSQNYGYSFTQFNSDIKKALQKYFKDTTITDANKCLKIPTHTDKTRSTTFGNIDVIPAFAYHNIQGSASSGKYHEGIIFYTNNNRKVINYPKAHYKNLAAKSKRTNGNFKATVRMFKNIKEDLINKGKISGDIVKSYFIENMLYNIDDTLFSISNLQQRFKEIVGFLIYKFTSKTIHKWKNANGFDYLVKTQTVQNQKSISIGIWDRLEMFSFLTALFLETDGH